MAPPWHFLQRSRTAAEAGWHSAGFRGLLPLLLRDPSPDMLRTGPSERASRAGSMSTIEARSRRYDPFVKARLWVTIKPKYVNMADINFSSLCRTVRQPAAGRARSRSRPSRSGTSSSFCSSPTAISSAIPTTCWPSSASAGRTTGCCTSSIAIPGMKVADLLDVLKITKQSLGRVLKQLVDEGYVVQKEGENDRRQRLLYRHAEGRAAGHEARRPADRADRPRARRARARTRTRRRGAFSIAMIDADGRDGVQKLIARADRGAAAAALTLQGETMAAGAGPHPARRRRAASAGGRRRPPHSRPAVALPRPARATASPPPDSARDGARQAGEPELRSADPRRDDAGRDRLRVRPRRSARPPTCRS